MSGQIKPISKLDVHKICSGQVVLNLATAVKELIENSLDAGATSIGLKFKEFGKDSIEVTDNGTGVHPDNFEGLALKHHTSKIQDFSDLTSVETFGFRGEALSSLCALSDVTVITRHLSQPCGTKLVFDRVGNIQLKIPIAKQIGTAVTLSNLFSSLPVRHKEFHRNLKKEFGKMIQVVTGYCLVATQVKLSCMNQTKSANNVLLSTHGSNTVLENISCIYGSKQTNNLLVLKKVIPEDEDNDAANIFEIDGYVSSCDHSCGRSSKDRQFYFINSRPCEPPKIIKAVNEIYHQYNQTQYPFVYLNIIIAKTDVDINVTPDKRQIFLSNENCLVSIIKASLNNLYKNIPSTYKINTTLYESMSVKRPCESNEITNFKQPKLDVIYDYDNKNSPISHSEQIKNKLNRWKSDKSEAVTTIDNFLQKTTDPIKDQNNKIEDNFVFNNPVKCVETIQVLDKEDKFDEFKEKSIDNSGKTTTLIDSSNNKNIKPIQCSKLITINDNCLQKTSDIDHQNNLEGNILSSKLIKCIETNKVNDNGIKCSELKHTIVDCYSDMTECSVDNLNDQDTIYNKQSFKIVKKSYDKDNYGGIGNSLPKIINTSVSVEIDTSVVPKDRKCTVVETNLEQIKERLKSLKTQDLKKQKIKTRFYATIDPNKNVEAENELSREISKDMFSRMSIIGQFNLGFIITKLDADLFIVDQHATDEKYNFETLQKTTKIISQKLVIPQQLELTAVNEIILMDNISIFQMNGFDFEFEHDAEPTKKIKLTMIPMSNNWRFGKEDIDELLFMLQDAPNTLCRPSRVRSMFASRACRKSVMIGTVLSLNDMRKLIDHMGVIEQPWNCPHGRPTMRHLVNLTLLNENSK